MVDYLAQPLAETNPEVAETVRREEDRQQNTLELIALCKQFPLSHV